MKAQPFATTDAEAQALEAPPSDEELARIRAKWQARVKGPLAGLLDARLEEFINDAQGNQPNATTGA